METPLKVGDTVFDTVSQKKAQVEKIDPVFIVLDMSFGESTLCPLHVREAYIKKHGSDGRYSIRTRHIAQLTKVTDHGQKD